MYNPGIANLRGAEIYATLAILMTVYEGYKIKDLKLDIQRGRPNAKQLDFANEMLDWGGASYICEDGNDARNYGGGIEGTPEARALFAEVFGVAPANIIAWGNSSLNIMHDLLVKALLSGVRGADKPWLAQAAEAGEKLKFICPVPGYDRHFLITETLGFELINVEMRNDGPDMDEIERLVAGDPMIKGIWNIPKYHNPTGITYSDEVVRRFAALKPKARDFRIFWDCSYIVHDLYEETDKLLNLLAEAEKHGNEDMVYMFASTSKITFAGAGITAFAASEANIGFIAKQLSVQTICSDKLNQLRHVRYMKNSAEIKKIMAKHASLIRPKFELVLSMLYDEFYRGGSKGRDRGEADICQWTDPRGGYFICLCTPDNCAKEALRLAAEAGVRLTPAGATFPYGADPRDRFIRIAPTVPSPDELETAMSVLAISIKIAYLKNKLK
jgi:aspartate/methionine/tyrosine aminotransferase